MRNRFKKGFKRVLSGTMALITAFSVASGFMMPVSAEGTDKVLTGTDLDNFDVSLNWGDKSEGLSDDYQLTMEKDGTASVKLQITIDYRGDGAVTYQPEELSIKLFDFTEIAPGYVDATQSMTYDIAAELKGSGSGRGDWYYTRSKDDATGKNYFTLTNKDVINTAFTSTVQVVYTLSKFRYWTPDSESKVYASVNDGANTVDAVNDLGFKYTGKRDVNKLSIADANSNISNNKPSNTAILSKIDSNDWNNYWYGRFTIKPSIFENNTIALKSGHNLLLELPDDMIFSLGGSGFNVSTSNEYMLSYYSTSIRAIDVGDVTVDFALPKDKYTASSSFDVKAVWNGTYLDSEEEVLIDTADKSFDVSYFTYDYISYLYDNIYSFELDDYHKMYQEIMEYGYKSPDAVNTSYSYLSAANQYSSYFGDSTYNMIVGMDKQYFIYADGTYRLAENDERTITSISVRPRIDYEIYGKSRGSSVYELITSGNETKSKSITIPSEDKQYSDVYIKYKNITGSFSFSKDSWYSKIYSNKELNNGKTISKVLMMGYMQIENINEDGSVSNVTFNNSYNTNVSGLNAELAEADKEEGNTKLRGFKLKTVSSVAFSADVSFKAKTFASSEQIKDERIQLEPVPNYMNSRDVGGLYITNLSQSLYKFNSYEATFEYSSVLDLDTENLKFTDDSSNNTAYSKEELESEKGWKVLLVEESESTGFKKLHIKMEYTGDKTINSDGAGVPIPKFSFSVSLDDYYMMDLGGTSASFNVSDFKVNIYCLTTDMNYDMSANRACSLPYPDLANNTYQGIETEVSTDAKPEYTKLKTKVNLDGEYSYKLKASAGETQMAKIVMYDNLEQQETSAWRGTFNGVSFEKLEQAGIDTSKFKTYYSTDRNQECSLDAEGWVLSADYKGKLEDVKSIAVDLDGYVLNTKQRMYIEVMMKSPAEGALGSTTLNQYNSSYQEFDESDVNLTTPLKTTTNLASNITEVALGDVLTKLTISKSWIDDNDSLKVRPNSVSGKIYQNGIEIRSFTLDKEHKWSSVIDDLRMYDDSGTAYEYTIFEDSVSDYVSDISAVKEENGNFSFIIKNTISDDLAVKVSGTKIWDDDNNSYGIRPAEISIDLYQNGTKIASTDTDAGKEWKYSFDYQPKFDSEGNEYIYTVQEHNYERYSAEYIPSKTGVRVHFSELSRTETVSYDYMEIYYMLDGKTYSMGRYGGTSIANLTVDIPTNDFYIFWRSDSSGNSYYGFAIDSVVPAQVEIPENQTEAVMQTVSGGYTECNGKNYPETSHNPYENNARQGWHYTAEKKNSIDIVNHLIRYQYLTITKLIPVDDEYQYNQEEGYGFYSRYFPEHGNPTFIFKIENDKGQAFYKTLFDDGSFDDDRMEITEINDVEYIKMSTKIKVEAGNYTISELKTSRYKLSGIETSENGTVSDDTAILDLTKSDGSTVFINSKSNWKNFSHNDLKLNKVGSKPM